MSALVQYEPFVDEVTEVFLNQTDKLFARSNKACDFAEWLQFYAFDVIGQITYSKRHGFIDRAEDNGMVRYLGKIFSYAAPVSNLRCPKAWPARYYGIGWSPSVTGCLSIAATCALCEKLF